MTLRLCASLRPPTPYPRTMADPTAMADSTAHDRSAPADVHAPRARKPSRIDLLRPQLSDDAVKLHLEAGSGVSRCAYHARRP